MCSWQQRIACTSVECQSLDNLQYQGLEHKLNGFLEYLQNGDPRAFQLDRAGQGGAAQAGQGRAGQGRAGQGRAGQGRAGQGRAGQGRAGQGRAAADMKKVSPHLKLADSS